MEFRIWEIFESYTFNAPRALQAHAIIIAPAMSHTGLVHKNQRNQVLEVSAGIGHEAPQMHPEHVRTYFTVLEH